MLDVNDFSQLRIGLATADKIRMWSNGEAPDNLEDVDLDADIDIGDIDIPEDDTTEAEA